MNIQELLEGVVGESAPKFPSFSSSICAPPCPSTSPNTNLISTSIISTTPSSSSSSSTATLSHKGDRSNNSEKNKSNNPSQNNLKCPRCDSTNTKFCYYNNYNLTQPRHFCKTCRRYWTKGGTLRNVPIGGGCRKNKSSSGHSSSALAKAKANLSTEMLANGIGINQGFLQNELLGPPLQPGPSPTLWLPSSSLTQGQNTSHILSLLTGATHFPNPSPNPNPSHSPIPPAFTVLKTEGNPSIHANRAPNFLGLRGPDVVQNGAGQSSNILELYQKWKLSSNYNNNGYSANENENENECGGVVGLGTGWMGLSTSTSSSSSSSPILKLNGSEALPLGGAGEGNLGGYRIWNSSCSSSWPEFPTVLMNATFP